MVILVDALQISVPIVQVAQVTHEEEVVEESQEKQPLFDAIEEEQLVEGLRYVTRERRPFGEWWLNDIHRPSEKEVKETVCCDDYWRFEIEDASKWELPKQEKYGSLTYNAMVSEIDNGLEREDASKWELDKQETYASLTGNAMDLEIDKIG